MMFFKLGVTNNFTNFTEKHLFRAVFNKVAGLKTCNFIKKRLQHAVFFMKFAEVLRTYCFTEHLR